MKYSIEATTIEPKFRWEQTEEGDWRLGVLDASGEWHHQSLTYEHPSGGRFQTVSESGFVDEASTLEEAKSHAEDACAGDILRNLAKIKKETDGLPTDN